MRLLPSLAFLAAMCAALFLSGCSGSFTPEVRSYAMGDRIVLGRLVYSVFETRWLPQMGEGPTARVPQNRFFLIRMSVGTTAAGEILIPNKTIEDDKGNSYAELSNGEGVPQWLGFLRPVTTGGGTVGNALFDAPPAHYRLHLSDENSQQTALVDIPLSFRAETPELPDRNAYTK